MMVPHQSRGPRGANAGRILDEVVSGCAALAGLALLITAVGYAHSRVGFWEQLARVHNWGLFREPHQTVAWWQELRPYGWAWAVMFADRWQLG